MQQESQREEHGDAAMDGSTDWERLRPHLDAALSALKGAQRDALIAHFMEGQPQSVVAARLGISENAAQKRIAYGLEKLRAWFAKRGMAVGVGVLVAGLSAESSAAEAVSMATTAQVAHIALHPPATAAATKLVTMVAAAESARIALVATALVIAGLVTAAVGIAVATHHHPPDHVEPPATQGTAAPSAPDLALQVASFDHELSALQSTLAGPLDDVGLAQAFSRDDDLLAHLAEAGRQHADEGIIICLAGEAELLRNREDRAIADFTAAIAAPDASLSRRLATFARASRDRARARLRHGFFDQMARLFIFQDQHGYRDRDADVAGITADLDNAGAGADDADRLALGLWVRYFAAILSPAPYGQYMSIHDDAVTQAKSAQAPTAALLMVGVLTPFPREPAAITAYSAAIAADGDLPQAWLLRAMERASVSDYDRAVLLAPNDALARLGRAQTLGSGQDSTILADLDAAVRLAPEEPECWHQRALARWYSGSIAGAVADFHRGKAQADDLGENYRGKSTLFHDQGEFRLQLGLNAQALTAFPAAKELGSDDARFAAARLLELRGDAAAGEALLAPLLVDTMTENLVGQSVSAARTWRAGVREKAGDVNGALADLDWIIQQFPQNLPTLVDRGELLHRAGRMQDALTGLDHAVTALRDWAASAKARGMANERADRHVADALAARASARMDAHLGADARADCTEALTLAPDHIAALTVLAQLDQTDGHSADAATDRAKAAAGEAAIAGEKLQHRFFTDAIAAYTRALAIQEDAQVRSAYVKAMAQRDQAQAEATAAESAAAASEAGQTPAGQPATSPSASAPSL